MAVPKSRNLVRMPGNRTATALVALVLVVATAAQEESRLLEPRVFGGLGVGLEAAAFINDSGAAFGQLPWFAGSLDVGASATYRDRWGAAVQWSGTINGYRYFGDNIDYGIYDLLWRTEARGWWLAHKENKAGSHLRIGCALGLSLNAEGYRERTDGDFTAISRSPDRTVTYVAPEIGFTKHSERHRMEFGLRYLYHLQRDPALYTQLRVPGAGAHATAMNDQLGLVMRYHLGFERRARIPPAPPAIDIPARTTDTLPTLHTRNQRITLLLWDNAEIDGDTISILLNEMPVVTGLALTARKQKVRLDLGPHTNRILVVAHNEGRVPPNTASCRVRGVPHVRELLIKTSMTTNQGWIIRRE